MPEDIASRLGIKVKAARAEKRFSQQELSDRTGISVKSIGKIENGTMNPSIIILERLVPVLGISLDDLISSDGHEADADIQTVTRLFKTSSEKARSIMLKTLETLANGLSDVE